MMADSDIRFSDPVVRQPYSGKDKQAECIGDLLHVHVFPDIVGINVVPHGDTLSLGIFGWSDDVPSGSRVKPGRLYEWRTRRVIRSLDAKIRRLKGSPRDDRFD